MEKEIHEIWFWIGDKEQYEKGVTNKDVINRFGDSYKKAWETLKQRSRYHGDMMFYEKGRWHCWIKSR